MFEKNLAATKISIVCLSYKPSCLKCEATLQVNTPFEHLLIERQRMMTMKKAYEFFLVFFFFCIVQRQEGGEVLT